jgi:ankyrin repeat protein
MILLNQFGSTALHDAAFGDHTEVVTLLLNSEADINTANDVSDIVLVL